GFCLRPSRLDYVNGPVFLAPFRRTEDATLGPRPAKFQHGLLGSPVPDVSGQENGDAAAGQTSEPAGAEAQYPGAELRCPAELIERHAEQECSEKPAAKADAGVQSYGCSWVPRGRHGEDTRTCIGTTHLHHAAH